jgi:UDP-glucose 4-epimerase
MSKTTALVTGGAGFIGSHVVDALLAEGGRVVVVDDLSTGAAQRVAPEAALEVVNILDQKSLDAVVDAAAPAAIIHLAAQSSVTRSVTEPQHDCQANVLGTLNVLEAAKRHPAPISPYGASKWAGEAYVLTWRRAHGIPHAVCRLGNVYGPRQSPHGEAGVVAIFTYHLWRGEAPTLYGFGRPTRDYVHVHDVAHALLAAVAKPGVFNIATGVKTDVMEIFRVLESAAETSLDPVLAPLRPRELEQSCMDATRARRELGWRAEINLHDGLKRTYHALLEEFEAGQASHVD